MLFASLVKEVLKSTFLIAHSSISSLQGTSCVISLSLSLSLSLAPLYVMIPPASSAEILQAMGQSRPIAPKSTVVATADLSNTDV